MSTNAKIIGHRGASFDAPENTVAAVRLAWERGADAVEVDARLSRDGRAVLMHDGNVRRTTGVDADVADLTYADLRALNAGAWKDARWSGERIPTLGEALSLTPAGRQLMVEIKCGPEIIDPLTETVEAWAGRPEELVFAGFSDETMARVKAALPAHRVYLISRTRTEDGSPAAGAATFVERARAAGLDGLSLSACDEIDAAFARQVHEAGLPLVVWTVDDPALAGQMVEAGVDAIATNRPGWLRDQLREIVSA